METGPPLNLSTSVKVEDCTVPKNEDEKEYGIRNELIKDSDGNQTYVLLKPVNDGSETLTITGEAVNEDYVEDLNMTIESSSIDEICPNSENKNKNYRCVHCSETFHRATQLRTHEKTHIEDKVHECDQCPEIFARLSLLIQHKQVHTKKAYSCDDCNISLNSYTSFRLHMKKHKSEKKFRCAQCSMSFSQQSHMITHSRKHTGEKPYICPICSTRFKQVSHLTTHMRTHTRDRPYSCDLCNASFSQTGSLKRHKRSHTGEKPFKCGECTAVFVEKRNLNRHMLSHSGIRPYKCDLCTASFTQLIDLKRHKLSHSGIKPYKCEVCEASFSRKNNLKWHKLTHEGDTPHICDVCNVGFRVARDLKSHKRTHAENKPYSCDQCNACFSQVTTLKRHAMVHSGHKHFSCQECNASFFEKSALKRHLARHGNTKPFSCELCMTSFLEARALKRHKIVMHCEGKYDENEETIGKIKVSTGIVKNINPVVQETNGEIKCSSEIGKTNPPTAEGSIGGINVSTGIIKNLAPIAEEENSLHICESSYPKSLKVEPITNLPISRNEVVSHSVIPEIFFNSGNSQNTSQQPTLVLTQPGQPPKTGRLANNCQNHNSHVHTLLEGSYNPWQAWCFCEPPNIPPESESLEIPCTNPASLVLSAGTSTTVSQSQSQALEFDTHILTPSIHMQQQEVSVPPQESVSQIHCAPSSLSHSIPKGQVISQVSNINSVQNQLYSSSQSEFQISNGYHYNNNASSTNDLSMINNCHETVNSHQQHIVENPQRSTLQMSKPSYIQIPNDEIISGSYSPQPSQSHFKKHFIYDKDHIKSNQNETLIRESNHDSLPVISSVEPINDNSSHQSVIIVSSESSKLGTQSEIIHSEPTSYTENPSHMVSINTNHMASGYKEFSTNKGTHEMDEQNRLKESIHSRLECTTVQNGSENQNLIYEQLPPMSSSDSKNQVTLQYSLTVNNPATGEIQIQSDVFSAKSTAPSNPKVKKKKITKQPVLQDKLNCTYCSKSFVKQGTLEMHLRTHTGEKPFVCGICSQLFSHNNSLTIHMRSHTGERPYTCIYCCATFTQKSNLRVHHRTHTGEKPFKCNVCEVSFSQGSHLKAHVRIHNNDRPFACAICGQAFTQRSALKRHQTKHTGVKPHSCTECDSKFSQRDDLRRHMMNHNQKSKPSVPSNKRKKTAKDIKELHSPKLSQSIKSKLSKGIPDLPVVGEKTEELKNTSSILGNSSTCSDSNYEDTLTIGKNNDILQESANVREPINLTEINIKQGKADSSERSQSSKMLKCKPKSQPLLEPSRTSRRIKEAAERKKLKPEDSDFITGDLEEIDIAEELENTLIKSTQIKVGKKKDGSNKKMYSDGVVQSWCFCEVPHGPDEPHTHMETTKIDKKASTHEFKTAIMQGPTSLSKNDYREGVLHYSLQTMSNAVSLPSEQITLQRGNMVHSSDNLSVNSGTPISDIHIVNSEDTVISSSESSSLGTSVMPTNNQLITSQVHANQLPVVETEDGKTLYASAQIISAHVLSGGQFVTQDGTFFIEASDIINNGTVVLNSNSPGTFYFDLGAEGQFVNVPVSVGTTMGHETQVLVPGTSIIEGNSNLFDSSNQPVSIQSSSTSFSDHVEAPLLENSQRTATVFSSDVNSSILSSLHSSVEQAESFSTSQMENLQYTSLDNNEIALFNPNLDFQALTNVVVKENKPKKTKTSKQGSPIVINPCKCTVCGKAFAQKVTLKTHMEEAHRGLQYCGVCFDAFTSKEHLNTHKLQHQTLSFSCSECSLSLETKIALAQHKQKQHNIGRFNDVKKEERAFLCNQCDSRFYQKSDLKRHSLGHTGEKPFKCWQCGAGFTRKYSLKKHERIHTGEKPYSCGDCDQSFAYRHQYNRHLSTHSVVEEVTTDPNILAIPLSHVLS